VGTGDRNIGLDCITRGILSDEIPIYSLAIIISGQN